MARRVAAELHGKKKKKKLLLRLTVNLGIASPPWWPLPPSCPTASTWSAIRENGLLGIGPFFPFEGV